MKRRRERRVDWRLDKAEMERERNIWHM